MRTRRGRMRGAAELVFLSPDQDAVFCRHEIVLDVVEPRLGRATISLERVHRPVARRAPGANHHRTPHGGPVIRSTTAAISAKRAGARPDHRTSTTAASTGYARRQ